MTIMYFGSLKLNSGFQLGLAPMNAMSGIQTQNCGDVGVFQIRDMRNTQEEDGTNRDTHPHKNTTTTI